MVNILPIRDGSVPGGIRYENQKELPQGARLTSHPDGTYSLQAQAAIASRAADTATRAKQVVTQGTAGEF
ncbi:MAG: hypothetical protein PHO92_03580 [Candidatus Peribacteraceae bacterium]|nr:hypothetical protein [Candidatus Peribacteraceae bacterium]